MKPIHLTNSLLQGSDHNILRGIGSLALTGICTCVFGICWERRWIIRILIPHGGQRDYSGDGALRSGEAISLRKIFGFSWIMASSSPYKTQKGGRCFVV
ncbi:MAG: hypothetical protein ACJ8AG_28230, partial [Ktedonobacteraceae bacterium]